MEEKTLNEMLNHFSNNDGYKEIVESDYKYYIKKNRPGSVTLKFEKLIEANMIDLISLIYEVNYYARWFPMVKSAKTLSQPEKSKKLCHFVHDLPLISDRDFVVYAFGVNRVQENRTILACSKSIYDDYDIFKDDYIKPGERKVRGNIYMFAFEIHLISHNKILVKCVSEIDPKIELIPQSFIDFGTKAMAKDLFQIITKICKNYQGSEFENKTPNETDKAFYNHLRAEAKKLYDMDSKKQSKKNF